MFDVPLHSTRELIPHHCPKSMGQEGSQHLVGGGQYGLHWISTQIRILFSIVSKLQELSSRRNAFSESESRPVILRFNRTMSRRTETAMRRAGVPRQFTR